MVDTLSDHALLEATGLRDQLTQRIERWPRQQRGHVDKNQSDLPAIVPGVGRPVQRIAHDFRRGFARRVKVMVDECISPFLARSLRELFAGDHEVVHIRDRFEAATTDLCWIRILSDEGGWVVLSADRRISRNKAEMHAFKSSALIRFFLCKTVYEKPMHKQFMRILAVWESIEAQVNLVRPGAMFEILERGEKF